MQVAVTGAAGFVGRAAVRRLHARGHRVRAVVRRADPTLRADETVIVPDLAGHDGSALAGCEAVVQCAARVHVLKKEPEARALALFRAANRDMPVALAQAAQAHGVRRFVQLSSLAAIASSSRPGEVIDDTTPPRPERPYGIAKLEADQALAGLNRGGIETIALRPPAVFGPGVGAWFALLMRAARAGLPLPVGRVANARSFIFVDNLADAIATAVESRATGAYVVSDSAPLSTAALYRRTLVLYGHGDRVWNWPAGTVSGAARAVLGSRADSFLGDAACDGARFATTTGWRPPVPFAQALAETVAATR